MMSTPEAQLLKKARQRVQWSQRDLAQRVGVTPGYIALLEKGARVPSPDLWQRVIDLFRVDPRAAGIFGVRTEGGASHEGPIARMQAQAVPVGYAPVPEFPVEPPLDPLWFAHIPFTVVAGPAGTGKSTFLRAWRDEIEVKGGRRACLVPLGHYRDNLARLQGDLLRLVADAAADGSDRPLQEDEESSAPLAAAAQRTAQRIEEQSRVTWVLCFDDWQPHGGRVHDFVQYLAAHLEKTPVLAATDTPHPVVPGAVVVSVPQPGDESWTHWCEMWSVPAPVAVRLLERIHHNPLAAVYLRGAVFSALSADPNRDVATLWHEVVHRVPSRASVPWEAILRACTDLLGKHAVSLLRQVAEAPAPIPATWIGDGLETGMMSRLIEYKFFATLADSSGPRVTVHEILRRYMQVFGEKAILPAPAGKPAPAQIETLIELLLSLGRYEDAAQRMEELAQEWLRRSEAPPVHIAWMQALPQAVARRHPILQLALARALAFRAHDGDVDRAGEILRELLEWDGLSDGLRWQALQRAADIAIRQRNYPAAEHWVERARSLMRAAPGSFAEGPLQLLAARVAWEQGRFEEVLAVLANAEPASASELARQTNWVARVHASLGDVAAAVRAAQRGLDIARRERMDRAEAYSSTLLAEYEFWRGNLARARRLVDRAQMLAKRVEQPNVEAQALALEAELIAANFRPAEAQEALRRARQALTQRAADPWSARYLLLSEGRVARMQPDWVRLYSHARLLEHQAAAVRGEAPQHPLVGALLVEAAWCWATANYMHEARRALATVRLDQYEWRTRWDARRLALLTEWLDESAFAERAQQLIQEAQAAGCPYLAATCGYAAASQAWQRGFRQLADHFGKWTMHVANARSWNVLALMAQGLLAPSVGSEPPSAGRLAVHADGTPSIHAPTRGQERARKDTGVSLTDAFEE